MAVRKATFDIAMETATLPTVGEPTDPSDLITKGFADENYVQGGASVADIDGLKAVLEANRKDGDIRLVRSVNALFRFDSASTDPGNDVTIVEPDAGTGRWILTSAAGEGAGLKNYVLNGNFNSGIQDWSVEDDAALEHETSSPLEGSGSLEITQTGTASRFVVTGDIDTIDPAYAELQILLDGGAVIRCIPDGAYTEGDHVLQVWNETDSFAVIEWGVKEGLWHYDLSFAPVSGKTYSIKIRDIDGTSGDVLIVDLVRVGPDPKQVLPLAGVDSPGLIDYYRTAIYDFAAGTSNFNSSTVVDIVRVGRMVTVSARGPIGHPSNSEPTSGNRVLPEWCRPTGSVTSTGISAGEICRVVLTSGGQISARYVNFSGTLTARVNTSLTPNFTFYVDD